MIKSNSKFELMSDNLKSYLLDFLTVNDIINAVIKLNQKFRNLKEAKKYRNVFSKMISSYQAEKTSLTGLLMKGGEKLEAYLENACEDFDEHSKLRKILMKDFLGSFLRHINWMENSNFLQLYYANSKTLEYLCDFFAGENSITHLELIPMGGYNFESEDITGFKFIKYAKNLQSLNISRINLRKELISYLLDCLIDSHQRINLTSLSVQSAMSSSNFAKLSDFLKLTNKLTHLAAYNLKDDIISERYFLQALLANQSITKLHLDGSTSFSTSNLDLLMEIAKNKIYEELFMPIMIDSQTYLEISDTIAFFAIVNTNHLKVSGKVIAPEDLVSFLEAINKNSNIKKLSILADTDATIITAGLKDNKNLKFLDIYGRQTLIFQEPVPVFENTSLETFVLQSPTQSGVLPNMKYSLTTLISMKNLKKITITNYDNLGFLMSYLLYSYPNLEEINLKKIKLSHHEDELVFRNPPICQLKKIEMNEVWLDKEIHLKIILSNQTQLETLKIIDCKLTDEGTDTLNDYLITYGNKTLTDFTIGANSIAKQGICSILKVLESNSILKSLNMKASQLYLMGAESCLSLLKVNTTLEILNLSMCGIKLEGCFLILDYIEQNPTNLKKVDLSLNFLKGADIDLVKKFNTKLFNLTRGRKQKLEFLS